MQGTFYEWETWRKGCRAAETLSQLPCRWKSIKNALYPVIGKYCSNLLVNDCSRAYCDHWNAQSSTRAKVMSLVSQSCTKGPFAYQKPKILSLQDLFAKAHLEDFIFNSSGEYEPWTYTILGVLFSVGNFCFRNMFIVSQHLSDAQIYLSNLRNLVAFVPMAI